MTRKPTQMEVMQKTINDLADRVLRLRQANVVLAKIADAYDNNALDGEARKIWGMNDEYVNKVPLDRIELYQGRGGRELLNLQQCMDARDVLIKLNLKELDQ